MKRRAFLSAAATAAVAMALPSLPISGLAFHPDAFAMAMKPLSLKAETFKKGDIITIMEPSGQWHSVPMRRFVVTADVTADD